LKLWESKLAQSPAVGAQQQFTHPFASVNYADPSTFNAAALMLPGTNNLLLMVNSPLLLGREQPSCRFRKLPFSFFINFMFNFPYKIIAMLLR